MDLKAAVNKKDGQMLVFKLRTDCVNVVKLSQIPENSRPVNCPGLGEKCAANTSNDVSS